MSAERYVEAFLPTRKAEGVTPKTTKWHVGALRLFVAWMHEEGHRTDPNEWDATLFRRYTVHLQQRPTMGDGKRGATLRPGTGTNYVQSLLAFTRWLHQEEFTERNAAAKVTKPKAPHLVQQPIPSEHVARLVTAAKADKRNGVHDLAMLYLLLGTGLRASELCGLKADDVVWVQNLIKVLGKGQKERIAPISQATASVIRKYAIKARLEDGAAQFFQTEEGRPMRPMVLLYLLKRLAARATVPNIHPHRLRHHFALAYLRNGGNVLALRRCLGHATVAMTSRYVACVTDDLAREHEFFSPVASLLSKR